VFDVFHPPQKRNARSLHAKLIHQQLDLGHIEEKRCVPVACKRRAIIADREQSAR
jgi:hypothetical protein